MNHPQLIDLDVAGGYDAIWLLVLDVDGDAEAGVGGVPSDRIQEVWRSWKGLDVSPLLASESMEKGIHVEDLASVKGLADTIGA